jgi:hypothetical protein
MYSMRAGEWVLQGSEKPGEKAKEKGTLDEDGVELLLEQHAITLAIQVHATAVLKFSSFSCRRQRARNPPMFLCSLKSARNTNEAQYSLPVCAYVRDCCGVEGGAHGGRMAATGPAFGWREQRTQQPRSGRLVDALRCAEIDFYLNPKERRKGVSY